MANADYEQHLAELRKSYIEATPRQRYSIARQRIEHLEHGPNVLVACVAAVEGWLDLLQCTAKRREEPDSGPRSASFGDLLKVQMEATQELIKQYLLDEGLPAPPESFGNDTWERLHYAIEYRNVLAHECTYLGQDRFPALIEACQIVLHKFGRIGGLKVTDSVSRVDCD